MTNGQRLYEHKNPPTIPMVPYIGRMFATRDDIVYVKNENHIPWQFLTAKAKQSWEVSAEGHHLFQQEK